MKTISIANSKGGVGKTSISSNIAYELARRGYLTLMIDLDPQCDLSKVYSPDKKVRPTIFNVLSLSCPIVDACQEVADNLYLIPGSQDLIHFDFHNSEHILSQCLEDETLVEVDFVIIDHQPTVSEATLTGFVASDEVLVVTDSEVFSLSNLGGLIDNLQIIQETMNSKLHVIGIVANKIDSRRNTDEFKNQMVQLFLKGKPRSEIIKEYDLTESAFDRWVKQSQATSSFREADNRSSEENELIQLRKENQRLKMENDILKQAALILGRK